MLSKYMIFASFFLFWARLHTELISIYSPWDLNIIRQDHTLLKYTSDYFQRIFVISRTCCTSSFTLKVPSFHQLQLFVPKKSTIDSLKNFDYWAL